MNEYVTVTVPKYVADKYFMTLEWSEISEPNIKEVAQYLGITVDKIKADMRKYDCPLRVSTKGSKGKGNMTRFYKTSVEQYKLTLKN